MRNIGLSNISDLSSTQRPVKTGSSWLIYCTPNGQHYKVMTRNKFYIWSELSVTSETMLRAKFKKHKKNPVGFD